MPDENLLAEANRQFTLCNACRYCEGLCSVFPAMELRTAFEDGDIAYLANLCHDCRACADACPFSEPHEFAIDIPALMSEVRSKSFERYARPRVLWLLLARPRSLASLVVLGLLFFALVALATGSPARIVDTHHAPGSFYAVIAYVWLVIPASVLSVFAIGAILAGARASAREARGGARGLLNAKANMRAAADSLVLRNLRGGGGGCAYPGDRVSPARRYLHHLVFYGFALMFFATVAAGVEQELVGVLPPYPIFSVPVALGTIGGLATVVGCVGFLILGLRQRDSGEPKDSRRPDRMFTTMLLASVLTGLLTLGLRSTPLMGPALILHLGVLSGLYLTFPYSKFVHWVYRYVALVRSHVELPDRDERTQHFGAPESVVNVFLPADNLDS